MTEGEKLSTYLSPHFRKTLELTSILFQSKTYTLNMGFPRDTDGVMIDNLSNIMIVFQHNICQCLLHDLEAALILQNVACGSVSVVISIEGLCLFLLFTFHSLVNGFIGCPKMHMLTKFYRSMQC